MFCSKASLVETKIGGQSSGLKFSAAVNGYDRAQIPLLIRIPNRKDPMLYMNRKRCASQVQVNAAARLQRPSR